MGTQTEKVIVTGAAGFIGFHLCRRLIGEGMPVTGVDNLNSYYDPALKQARLALLKESASFSFHQIDLDDQGQMKRMFQKTRPDFVVHLAAQAGVRYSLKNPQTYIQSNVMGFLNVLEGCRCCNVKHLTYASSSSVYGLNSKMPFSVTDPTDRPVSLYGATKKTNELMAHSYSHLYGIPTTGLRFFTVYGPWGRPDMAYFSFTKAIDEGQPIFLFNNGKMRRDFTYVDDIIEGVVRVMRRIPQEPPAGGPPYRIYNIGNEKPVELERFVEIIEDYLGKKAHIEYWPMQAGDVLETCADVQDLIRDTGFAPATPLEEGMGRFLDWYGQYYQPGGPPIFRPHAPAPSAG